MEVSGQFPAPVLGVSTLAERTRANGQMSEQINMSSDPVQKLTRRPPARWGGRLTALTTGSVKSHVYVRDEKEFRLLLASDGTVKAFIDNVSKTVTGNLSAYVDQLDKTVLCTVNDTTFVVNQEKVVRMLPDLDTIQRVTHVNVTAALNYGETVRLDLHPVGGTAFAVSYTIPDIGATSNNLDAADKARATAKVAEELALSILIAGAGNNIGVSSQGSTIAIWDTSSVNNWVDVRIATGQGDRSTVVINQQVENIAGLPLYAVVGTRIKVRPNPTSDKGTYYLTANRVSPTTELVSTLEYRYLEEVVWTESRSEIEPFKLDATTMPHVISYNAITDSFYVGVPEIGWAERKTGDNVSCKKPAFVDSTITTASYMQKRLVFLSGNDVSMTRTDDIFNWWKSSAVQLLVTDPISIASSATGIDKLKFVVPHNKDLLIVASNAQFKIPGDTPVTPETVSMPLVATYNCSVDAEPKALGSSVFLPVSYGESCGIFEYTREQNKEQDNATSVSNHVVGYMQGHVEKITTSANLDIIALRASGSERNTLFIFEQFMYSREELQQSWSKWVFPFEIVDFDFVKDSLNVLYLHSGALHTATVNLYSRISEPTNVFLDRKIELTSSDGITFTLPANYDTTSVIAVVEEGKFKLNQLDYTIVGNTLTLERNIAVDVSPVKISLGVPYTSMFAPTRPFIRDQNGRVITDDRLSITRFILHLVNTGSVTMVTKSQWYDDVEQRFVSRTVGGLNAQLGRRDVYTGDQKFSFGHEAGQATVEFYTNDHLGLTVAGMSWVGQHNQTRRRM